MTLDLARELIRRPSPNPPGEEHRVASFVTDWFAARDFEVHQVARPDANRPSVAAEIGSGPPRVVLNAHTDVVPVADRAAWSVDPYAGTVSDGHLYGRGSADTKASLALAMAVAAELKPDLEAGSLGGTLIVHAPAGEETGYPGTEELLSAGHGGDVAIVLEPTGCRVATCAKGVATYRLTVGGRSAHASRPDDARNPIRTLRTLIDRIERYDESLDEVEHPLVGRAHATVTEVAAGLEDNMAVVPETASLLLDRRLLPAETLDTVEADLDQLCHDVDVDRTLVQHYASAAIDPDHRLARVLREHATAADVSADPMGLEAATDARSFIERGMPAVIWGPGELAQAHTVDEHIAIAAIEAAHDGLRRAVPRLLELDW